MRLGLPLFGLAAFLAGCQNSASFSAHNEEPYTPVETAQYAPRTASAARSGGSSRNVTYTHPIRYHHDAGDSGASPGPSSLAELDMAGAGDDSSASSSYTTPSYSYSSSSDEVLSPAGGRGQVHLVRKGDTLFKLARDYYNNESRWREIYAANQQRLGGNPDRVAVGMKLIIP